MKTKSRKFDIY